MSLMFMNEQEALVADLPSGRPPVLHLFPPFLTLLVLFSFLEPLRSTCFLVSPVLSWLPPVLHPF